MASFRAHLSPNEETTLRRIAVGAADWDDIRDADVRRLVALGLVRVIDGDMVVTKHGFERCPGPAVAPPKPMARRHLKTRRRLPF